VIRIREAGQSAAFNVIGRAKTCNPGPTGSQLTEGANITSAPAKKPPEDIHVTIDGRPHVLQDKHQTAAALLPLAGFPLRATT
jgi:hypothetical protein